MRKSFAQEGLERAYAWQAITMLLYLLPELLACLASIREALT